MQACSLTPPSRHDPALADRRSSPHHRLRPEAFTTAAWPDSRHWLFLRYLAVQAPYQVLLVPQRISSRRLVELSSPSAAINMQQDLNRERSYSSSRSVEATVSCTTQMNRITPCLLPLRECVYLLGKRKGQSKGVKFAISHVLALVGSGPQAPRKHQAS